MRSSYTRGPSVMFLSCKAGEKSCRARAARKHLHREYGVPHAILFFIALSKAALLTSEHQLTSVNSKARVAYNLLHDTVS